jgi:hypothetical protein
LGVRGNLLRHDGHLSASEVGVFLVADKADQKSDENDELRDSANSMPEQTQNDRRVVAFGEIDQLAADARRSVLRASSRTRPAIPNDRHRQVAAIRLPAKTSTCGT